MEKRNAQDWDIQKLERLAVAYMAVRKEMWGLLAAQINERWPNVEAKVSRRIREPDGNAKIMNTVHGKGHQEHCRTIQVGRS